MKLQTLINLFLADVCGGKTNETAAAYRGKLRRLTAFFGPELEAELITLQDLDRFKINLQTRDKKTRWKTDQGGKLSPFTIRTVLVTTRFLFSWAASKRYIPVNPMEGVRIQTPPPPHPKAITTDTVIRLLEAAAVHGPDWERVRNVALIYTLRDTGGRVGGFVDALITDLDLNRGWIMVTEKGNLQRPLFLTETTIEALRRWIKYRNQGKPKDDRLFTARYGRGLSREGIYRVLERLAKLAGLEPDERSNPHSFRHAFARDSLLNGADLSQVSALMGHTDTRVTSLYYARWNHRELQKAHSEYSPVLDMPEIRPELEGVEE